MNTQHTIRWLVVVLVLLALVGIPLAPAQVHAASDWYAATFGSDGNSCDSPSMPCATINGVIAKAQPGDTIHVSTGTFTGTESAVMMVDRNLTITGGWKIDFSSQEGLTIIDGEAALTGIHVPAGVTAQADHFIFQNSPTGTDHFGVYCEGTLTLDHAAVQNNGNIGVYVRDSTGHLTLNNSSVSANGGNGILINWAAELTLNNSTISGNGEDGILSWGGYGVVPQITLNNSTISSNGDTGIDLSAFGNAPPSYVTLNNTTISNNNDSGIFIHVSTVTTQNSIIARNVPFDCTGNLTSAGHNLIGNTTLCSFTPAAGDLVDIDPLLAALMDDGGPTLTHALQTGSPAINAGDPAACFTLDQRGAPRWGTCDMGAYEYGGTLVELSASLDPAVFGEPVTLTAQVREGELNTPTGTMTFSYESGDLGTAPLDGSGKAELVTSALPLGSHTLTTAYSGDANFTPSTSPDLALKVGYATQTDITADTPDPSVVGQPVSVSFTVSSGEGIPSGNVMVTDEGGSHTCMGLLSSGAGSCQLTLTEAGITSLNATYLGEGDFNSSVDSEPHAVDKVDTTAIITTDNPDPSDLNQPVTVEFTVNANPPGAGTPSGSVTVTASGGAESCSGELSGGMGSCQITLVEEGQRPLTAAYAGDVNFSGSISNPQPHTVNRLTGICLPYISKACAILYADYFDNPASGWPVYDDGIVLAEYRSGEYRILVRATEWGSLSRPGAMATDFSASVDLRNVNSVKGSYGIAFGIAGDWSSFYTLEIYPDGWFGIYRYDPEGYRTYIEQFSPTIYQGSATNHITIRRNDIEITAYANGTLIATVIEYYYTGNPYLGLVVFSYDQPNVDIRFDNFKVEPADCTLLSAELASSRSLPEQRQIFTNIFTRAK